MSIILPLSLNTYRLNSFNNNTKYFFFDTVLSALKVILSCLIFKKKKKKPYGVSTVIVTTSVIKKLRHPHRSTGDKDWMHYVLRACGGNLSSCLLLGPPQLILSLISLTAMIPAVLSRNLCKEFVGQAKAAVNPLEATGERDTSGIRPPGWWALIESGTLVLRCVLQWNSPLWLYLSHLLCPNHAMPSTSQSVSQV